jgi:preprotein translocase subunit Sss1
MLKKIVKFGLVGTLALGLVGFSIRTKEECDKDNLDRV